MFLQELPWLPYLTGAVHEHPASELIGLARERSLSTLGLLEPTEPDARGTAQRLGLTAWAFLTQHFAIVPGCIFAFIAAHALGQGTVIWVFISEIFPNRHRAGGQALGSFTHWIFAALLATLFPKMVSAFAPGYIFLFFCGMMVLQLIWVKTMVIETKGVPLEQVQKRLGIS